MISHLSHDSGAKVKSRASGAPALSASEDAAGEVFAMNDHIGDANDKVREAENA